MRRAFRTHCRHHFIFSFAILLLTSSCALLAQAQSPARQYASWSSITNGSGLGNGTVRKTSTGVWDFSASATQTLLAGDGYFESTAANYNQSIGLSGADAASRALVIGSGGWAGIYENGVEVAGTYGHDANHTISAHWGGDRYRLEITNGSLRYVRYRSGAREILYTSSAVMPVYPISFSLGMSPQNAEWRQSVFAQLTRKSTWSSIANGIDLGNGSVRKTSIGVWDFSAGSAQTLLRGDGYFESTASYYNQSISVGGSDGAWGAILVGTGGWAAIYENNVEVAGTYGHAPGATFGPHAAGDRYRLETTNGKLSYVRYRSGVRTLLFTSANPLPTYPLGFGLGASFQNSEWQNSVFAQITGSVSWSSITNGIDLGNGSVRKTSTGVWDFGAGAQQQLVSGSGYFESTASYYNHSISVGGSDGAWGAVVVGTGGWAAIYENGVEVAGTYGHAPAATFGAHAAGDRYRLEITRGKLRYVRYRSGVRTVLFTSAGSLPAYPLSFSVGASFQNSEWQNTIFSDNVPEHNDAQFISQTVPATMTPGQNYSVSVTMRNTGASTWTPDGDYQLGSENLTDNQTWGSSRVNLSTAVPPGSDATFNFTVTAPTTPGAYGFQWRMVQNGVQRFGPLTTNVSVQTVNNPPTVSLTNPSNNANFNSGSTVTLNAAASDSDGTISKVEFFQGSTKLGEDTTAPYSYAWTNVAAGNYVLTARATDNGGAIATSSAVNITVTTPNQPPVANTGGPYNGFRGLSIQFNGGGSSDPDGLISSYQWSFGDGQNGSGATPTHTYTTLGTKTVTLTVTDNAGATNSATTTVTIANQPPVANPGGPYSGYRGVAIQLSGGGSSDPDGTISTYQWSFDDGGTGAGATVNHTFTTLGTHTATLTVTDNDGATNSVSATVTVANQPPVANAGGPYNGFRGLTIQFNGGGSSDPDGLISSYQWSFGDGQNGSGATPTHTYTTLGTKTVTLTVTDNDGATNNVSATVTVANQPPVANAGGPYNGFRGLPIQFNGSGSSDPDGTISTYQWSFDDGGTGAGATVSHTFTTLGTHTATLTVTDNDGATNNVSATVTVANQSPVANPGGPYSGYRGVAIQLSGGGSSDPDGLISSYQWSFDDGGTGAGATVNHTFTTLGTHTATLTVTDNDGATNSVSATVTVANQPPVANTGGPYNGFRGLTIQFNGGGSSDPDGTISTYEWSFDDGGTGSGATVAHTFTTLGTHSAQLTVTDNNGSVNSATASVTIANQPPVANAGGPYNSFTGVAVQFNGNASSDPDGTISTYAWSFGDSTSGSGVTPTHTYASVGTYAATLTVTDNNGATHSATASVSITASNETRLDPLNRTGGGSEDPLSRNFNWGLPLVGLPGRSGLDLGLSLSYNSLATWTKNGSYITFDDDHGFPAPGFRLGFPVIQSAYFNTQASSNAFLMITPSGARVELRQVGTSPFYQSMDSSYVLLDSNTMILRTTDGTQLSYAWKGDAFKCTQIKDRNGNVISINYDASTNRLMSVVDTLNRTISFNYDGNDLASITQSWYGQTHYWARFAYANKTIQTNFSGLTVYGPANNTTIRALTQVKLADDSHYDFDYNSWGQVWKISQYTNETTAHLLNYVKYNLPADATNPQSDCPRFTQRHDWAENWNLDSNGNAQEVTTYFDAPIDTSMPDNSLQTVSMAKVITPDGTYQKTYFAGSISGGAGSAPAWQRGLPLRTDTYEANNATVQRSATTTWAQDNESVPYQLNPRMTETNISDALGNHARTRVEYIAFNLSDGTTVRLPENVKEYRADATTVLRRRHTTYRTDPNNSALLDPAYADLRIIGLVSEKTLYEVDPDTGAETLMSKVSYAYDESGSIQGTDAPVQHDNTNYTANFTIGRANVSRVTRHNVVSTSQSTTSTVKYNTAGAVVETTDPLSHTLKISYEDRFSANGEDMDSPLGFTTLGYPTTVTDPDNFTSTMRYNYAFGGTTRKQTPLPNVPDNQGGPVQITEYDTIGRLKKVRNTFNNAYTRYEYHPTYVETFATVNTVADQAHSKQYFDGAGRVIGKATNHPGSIGGYSGQQISYDVMGRVVKQSNPTETSASGTNPYAWMATGDDDPTTGGPGWAYTRQTYDWKGRPRVTTNPDNTTKTASYDGCGCAGGEVVTLASEIVLLPPQSGAGAWSEGRRRQRMHHDVLGRVVKSEVLNQDGTPYSTAVREYNARDQLTALKEYKDSATTDGSCPTGTCQLTTMSYDGYGRLQTKHVPEQNAGTATTWAYNSDDTIQSVTDARGVTVTNNYNARHLLSSVSYPEAQSLPSGVASTSNVTYEYDAAGNTTSVTDGTGSVMYHYDQLSRMDWEERTFVSLSGSTYRLSYGYNLAGQLTTLSEPSQFGSTVNYIYDQSGKLNNVAGAGFAGGVSQFASNMKYRAWGTLKEVDYGNGLKLNNAFNSRLQITNYQVKLPGTPVGEGERARSEYEYFPDGQTKISYDRTDERFNRGYSYDHASRMIRADSGAYNQTFAYDAFNNMTLRSNLQWRRHDTTVSQYLNNRNTQTTVFPSSYPSCCPPQPSYWTYDANGNVTQDHNKEYTYDAAGNSIRVFETTVVGTSLTKKIWIYQDYGADGERVKRVEQQQYNSLPYTFVTTYYLRSSVLDSVIAELDQNGARKTNYVYGAGQVIARQNFNQVLWVHADPITNSVRESAADGSAVSRSEFDPLGNDAPLEDPQPPESTPDYEYVGNYGNNGNPYDGPSGCSLDGQPMPCSLAMGVVNKGAGGICPDNRCASYWNGGRFVLPSLTDEGWMNAFREWRMAWGIVNARTGASVEKWRREGQRRRRDQGQRPQRGRQQKPPTGGDPNAPLGGKSSGAVPCDVVLADVNQRDLIATLMGEAFHPGDPLYTHATNDGRGNSSHDAAKHPDSYATEDDIDKEMQHMVSVFENRRRDWGGLSWSAIAHTRQTNGKYQFEGYPNGLNALNNLGAIDSANCKQARRALRAMEEVNAFGPINRDIHFWHGVLQTDKAGPFVRVRNGALRIGGSDFW